MSEHEERDSLPVRRARQFELEEPYGGWGPPSAWAPEEEEGVDFERLFDLLMRRKWWILLATGLGVAAGAFLMRTAPATYETEATIWVQARNRQQSNQTGPIEAPEVLEGQGWTDLFTSRAVLEPVVRDQKLFLHLPDTTAATRALFADFDVSDSVQGGRYSLS
ncbi:MAG TPA: Wzz/FepE/Etk N-terminal domain-containing protein, partial [Gemmatimonadota bacterium]|nr:Wzz/FepE/Etk N-terminal domain-containing protein [Gemmatimonadota bacterium]